MVCMVYFFGGGSDEYEVHIRQVMCIHVAATFFILLFERCTMRDNSN